MPAEHITQRSDVLHALQGLGLLHSPFHTAYPQHLTVLPSSDCQHYRFS